MNSARLHVYTVLGPRRFVFHGISHVLACGWPRASRSALCNRLILAQRQRSSTHRKSLCLHPLPNAQQDTRRNKGTALHPLLLPTFTGHLFSQQHPLSVSASSHTRAESGAHPSRLIRRLRNAYCRLQVRHNSHVYSRMQTAVTSAHGNPSPVAAAAVTTEKRPATSGPHPPRPRKPDKLPPSSPPPYPMTSTGGRKAED